MLNAIINFLFLIFLIRAIGNLILNKFFKVNLSSISEICMGISILSYFIFLLGIIGALKENLMSIIAILLYIFFIPRIKNLLISDIEKSHNLFANLKYKEKILLIILFLYLFIGFLNCFTYPYSRDALNYHLFLPKIWLQNNKIFYIKSNIYSFFPHLIEMIYLLCLAVSNDFLPKMLHYFFFLLCIYLIFSISKSIIKNNKKFYAIFSLLIFITTPMNMKFATWAYIDFAYSCFILLTISLILKFYKSGNKKFLYLSGIFAGFSMGIKYLAIVWWVLFNLYFLFKKQFKNLLYFSLISILIASPWYIRNFIWTGNPFFPFLYNFFDGKFWNKERAYLYLQFLSSYGQGIKLKDLFLFPFRIIIHGNYLPHGFDGKISFVYLLILPLIVFCGRNIAFPVDFLLILTGAYFIFWFYTSQQLRFLIPCFAILSIIINYILHKLKYYKFISKIILLISLFSFIFYLYYPVLDFKELRPDLIIRGKIKRDEFLTKRLKYYPIINYINKELPQNSKLMLIHVGAIGYYLNRDFYQDSIFEEYSLMQLLKTKNIQELINSFRGNNISYLLINEKALYRFLFPYLKKEENLIYIKFKKENLIPLLRYKDLILYRFKS